MLTRGALGQVLSDPTVAARLEAARVYEILTPGEPPLAAAGAEPVVTFSAVSTLRQAVNGGQLPAGTRAVLYDPEVWPYTPVTEQRDPVQAARQAAAVTRAHHLTLIVAPALDLATAQPRTGGPLWRQYLRLNLIGGIARVAGVVEVQAQSLERDPQVYRAFVRAAAAQARAANPHVSRAGRAVHESARARWSAAGSWPRPSGSAARSCPATGSTSRARARAVPPATLPGPTSPARCSASSPPERPGRGSAAPGQ